MNRLAQFVAGLLVFASHATASEPLTRAQCLADISEALDIIQDVHPNPYATTTKDVVDQRRLKATEQLPDAMDRRELFLRLAPIVASLRDGHTSLRMPMQDFRAQAGAAAFPIDVSFDGKALIVVDDWSPESIPSGATIHRINGRNIEDIVSELMPFQHAELPAARMLNIANYFRAYLWGVCRMKSPFRLAYSAHDAGRITDVIVSGTSLADMDGRRNAERGNFRPYQYRHLEDINVGVLSFNVCQPGVEFDQFLRDTFTKIQRDDIRALVVDARKNGGGSARANVALFDYLTDQRYRMCSGGDIKISDRIKQKVGRERFEDRFAPWNSSNGSTLSERGADLFWYQPGENHLRYRGPLYVFSGTGTQSSGMNFVCAVKDCQLGLVVGEETGAPATAFGDLEPFQLSNSGLELYVSTKYFIRPNESELRRGVLPDIPVKQSRMLNKSRQRDAALEAVKAHLNRR